MTPAKPARLRQAALEDLSAAHKYYARIAPHQADTFLDRVAEAQRHIELRPETGSPRYAHVLDIPELRSWRLEVFPYLVFYIERADWLDVLRLLHQRRDIPALLTDY